MAVEETLGVTITEALDHLVIVTRRVMNVQLPPPSGSAVAEREEGARGE